MSGTGQAFVIETRRLTKSYNGLLALDSVDVKIPRGPVGLLGPNGAGKSTLIKCVLGLATSTSGDFTILGSTSSDTVDPQSIRERVGYVPEADCLIPDMEALSYVRFMGELSGLSPMDAMQRSHEVLNYVGLAEERYRKIGTFSTGMQQKVKLAQALVHDPEILILDEPTSGMDPKGRQEMLDLIKDISGAHKKSMLFSSHLLPDIEYVCEDVLIMDQGKILLQGSLKELMSSSGHMDIRIKGDASKFSRIIEGMKIPFERKGSFFQLSTEEDVINEIYSRVKGTGIQIRHATRTRLTLEDIFLSKVKGGGK